MAEEKIGNLVSATNLSAIIRTIDDTVHHSGANPSGHKGQGEFLQMTAHIDELMSFVDTVITSKTKSGGRNDAGYIKAIENLRKLARPLLLCCFCFLLFAFEKLSVIEPNQSVALVFWGISLAGLSQSTLLQGLFYITSYYAIRFVLVLLLLKFTYPWRVRLFPIPFLNGRNYDEIQSIESVESCLSRLKEYLARYNLPAGIQLMQTTQTNDEDLEVHVSSRLSEIEEAADQAKRAFVEQKLGLIVADFFKFNLALWAITAFAGYCLFRLSEYALI